MVRFDTPLQAGFNLLMIALWLAALADVIRSPRRDWDNRRGKVLTALLVAGPTLYSAGVFIPLGAVAWFAWWRNAGGLGHLPKQRRSGPPTTTRPSSGAEET